jgi:hypothetical protein
LIDLTHPAHANLGEDVVAAEAGAGLKGQRTCRDYIRPLSASLRESVRAGLKTG